MREASGEYRTHLSDAVVNVWGEMRNFTDGLNHITDTKLKADIHLFHQILKFYQLEKIIFIFSTMFFFAVFEKQAGKMGRLAKYLDQSLVLQ